MPPKAAKEQKPAAKKVKSARRKKDGNLLKHVDRTFYELTITDLNKKIANLRLMLEKNVDKCSDLERQLKDFQEDREDVANVLQRMLNKRIETTRQLEDTIERMELTIHEDSVKAAETIHQWETKYKDMRKHLLTEMKLINGQLKSLKEFQIIRDGLFERYDDLWEESKEREQKHEEQLFDIQKQILLERDVLKSDVEHRLIQLAEDIRLSNDIRNAGYTQRLVRENVALQKEVEAMISAQFKMQDEFRRFKEKNKYVHEEYSLLQEMHRHVLKCNNNKVGMIEKLTENYEHLKAKYVEALRYRELYENLMKIDSHSDDSDRGLRVQVRDLSRALEEEKLEKSIMESQFHKIHEENKNLQNIIQEIYKSLKLVIENARDDPFHAKSEEDDGVGKETDREQRRLNLLNQLTNIIVKHACSEVTSPSVVTPSYSEILYEKGCVGFVPPTRVCSIMEIFKKGNVVGSSMVINQIEPFSKVAQECEYIPKERSEQLGSIIDVEWGTSFYVSSEHVDQLSLEQKDEKDELSEPDQSSSFDTPTQADKTSELMAEVKDIKPSQPDIKSKLEKPQKSEESLHTDITPNFFLEEQEIDEDDDYSTELFY